MSASTSTAAAQKAHELSYESSFLSCITKFFNFLETIATFTFKYAQS